MKRTFIIAASSLGLLFVGTGLPVANASSTPALANAGTALLASTATAQSKQERREIRQMQKAADRRESLNQRNQSGSSSREARSGSRDRGNSRADRNRGSSRGADRGHSSSHRGSAHDRHRSYRDHHSHSRYPSSSYRHHDRHHDNHRSGVHFGVSSGGVHFGVHSGSYGHHSYSRHSYGHRSYRHHTYTRPYRYYQPRTYYRSYSTCPTPVIQREVVVIEREPVVRETVVVRRPTASSVDGLRGWDYLIHGEAARSLSYFSDLCQTYYDEGLPKLGFGLSALAKGDLRNGAHGVRRAFEFDADGVSDGPPVSEFDELVAELRAGVEHRIETDAHVTSDHWFLSAAMAFYDKDYHNAKYAIDAAKNLGDTSRGCVALAQMIDGKIAYEESMRGR